MKFRRSRTFGQQANSAIHGITARIDGRTAEAAQSAARAIVVAVRLLRIPSAVVGAVPIPFIVTTFAMGLLAEGTMAATFLVIAGAMAVVNVFFWARRWRIMTAAQHPEQLATELAIVISMSGKVDETRGALAQIAGGGGWRVMGRLRGVWQGAQMTGRWIEGAGDLERARYFVPPKIGTTVTLTIASLWLIPISVVVTLFAVVGTIAGSI